MYANVAQHKLDTLLASILIAIRSVSSRNCHPRVTFAASMVEELQGSRKGEGMGMAWGIKTESADGGDLLGDVMVNAE